MIVRVTTPSRLHFGLFSFGRTDGRQHGGVGAMLERPGVRLTIERAERTAASGPLAERAVEFTNRVVQTLAASRLADGDSQHRTDSDPQPAPGDSPGAKRRGYQIVIEAAPPDHVGLGTGTQLGLAIAAGILRLNGQEIWSSGELAYVTGRGGRSGIGTYGFLRGGLLMEAGKLPGETLSPLIARVEPPPAWRFVLLRPTDAVGLSGTDEQRAFADLPPVPESVTQKLCTEAELHLFPAAMENDFAAFSRSLGSYSRLAGECFAARQGGPFAGQTAARLVKLLKSLGVEGVGQSSWGPTLFALQPDQAAAEILATKLRSLADAPLEIIISPPANRGATIGFEG